MNDRDIWLNFAEEAVTMHEGVKFVGIICNAEVWFVKDKAVGDFLRGPSAKPIQFISPAPPQARAELRDRFAAAALSGLLTNPKSYGPKDDYAKWAYQYADAMLATREENSQ